MIIAMLLTAITPNFSTGAFAVDCLSHSHSISKVSETTPATSRNWTQRLVFVIDPDLKRLFVYDREAQKYNDLCWSESCSFEVNPSSIRFADLVEEDDGSTHRVITIDRQKGAGTQSFTHWTPHFQDLEINSTLTCYATDLPAIDTSKNAF